MENIHGKRKATRRGKSDRRGGKKQNHTQNETQEEERFTKIYPVLGRRRLGGNSNIGRNGIG